MDTATTQTMQTANSGLDQSKCLTCQRNPANPPEASPGQSRGILCRKCQSGVLRALRSHELPEAREAREARARAAAAAREARAAKRTDDAEIYL